MTRSVADAAVMLGVLEGGRDPNDPRTSECQAPPNHDYTAFLKADALKGARIGIPRAGFYEAPEFPGKARPFRGLKPDEKQSMEDAIAAIKAAGAEIVDPADLPSMIAATPEKNLTAHNICELMPAGTTADDLCSAVIRYGMKRDFNLWLATLGASAPVKTLTELRAWNLAHKDAGAIRYGQGRLDAADAVDLDKDKPRYERNRREDLTLTREEGLGAAITRHKLDALLFPGSSGANYATKAGYPIIVVPFGMVINYEEGAKGAFETVRPFGVSFVGAHCDDPKLVSIRVLVRAGNQEASPAGFDSVERGADEGSIVMMKQYSFIATIAMAVLLANPVIAAADEIGVSTARAIATVLAEVGAEFERATGHRLICRQRLAGGLFQRRVDAGEAFDLLISGSPPVDEWIRSGRIAANTRDEIARSGIGVEVRAGSRSPTSARWRHSSVPCWTRNRSPISRLAAAPISKVCSSDWASARPSTPRRFGPIPILLRSLLRREKSKSV